MRMTDKGWTYTPSAVSYEPGHLNVLGLLQLEHAIDQRLLDGVVAVAKHNAVLIQSLANDIAETKFNLRGGADTQARASILCIEAEQVVGEKLKQAGFAVTWRRGLIRISPHFYNTKEEIDALVLALKAS